MAWAVGVAGFVVAGVSRRLGYSNAAGVALFVAGWVGVVVLMPLTALATVRYGGPFGSAGPEGGADPRPDHTPPAEFHGAGSFNAIGPQDLRVRLGPILSFGRMTFDEQRVGIRDLFMDRNVERQQTRCIEVTDRMSVSWFAIIGPDGRPNRLTFGTRDRQAVVDALRARGWPVLEHR